MKLNLNIKTVERLYITIGNEEFDFASVMEILESLEFTDMLDRVVIYDSNLKKVLEELKVISTNSRGSSMGGRRYDDFYNALLNLKPTDEPTEYKE